MCALKHFPWLVLLPVIAGCSASPQDNDRSFYSWVDPQGNVVSVVRDGGASQPSAGEPVEQGGAGDPLQEKPVSVPAEQPRATTPAELWQLDITDYEPENQVSARLEARDRERFVSYPDESGRVATHPLDMTAVRESTPERSKDYEELPASSMPYIERNVTITANCCEAVLDAQSLLGVGEQRRLVFRGKELRALDIGGLRPALVFLLEKGVKELELQTWISDSGYVHPQVLFFDSTGKPLLLVDNVFSRRYRETLFAWPSLHGIIPVIQGADRVAIFLPYAALEDGRLRLSGELVPGQEPGATLTISGDVVIGAR